MKQSNEQEQVEFSRRGFFGRFAIGAVLSLALPGVVQAAKSADVKANKHRLAAQPTKTNVRLPKKNTLVHDIYASRKPTAPHGGTHLVSQHPHQEAKTQRLLHARGKQPLVTTPSKQPLFLAEHSRLDSYRALAFDNINTGEKLSLTYFEKGRYLNDALREINLMLRDHRTDEVHPIDTELLDQLHDLKQMLGLSQPFNVICGYRSPLTNAKLHAEHTGAANNSFHIYGRAVDIRIERFDLRRIQNAALAMHRGGVGFYPASNYIHLDTGTFRTWAL